MKIRPATIKDAKNVFELYRGEKYFAGNAKEPTSDYSLEDIKDYISKRSKIIYVCMLGEEIIGSLGVEFHKTYAFLSMVAVRKDFRKKGVASSLINRVEKECKKRNVKEIEGFTSTKNKPMQYFFKKQNWGKGNKFYFYSKILK